MPDARVSYLEPLVRDLLKWRTKVRERIVRVMNEKPDKAKSLAPRTILHTLRDNERLLPEKKTEARFSDKGMLFLRAGGETAADTSRVVAFYLLSDPPLLERLRMGLIKAVPDPTGAPALSALEQLPLLIIIVQEGLRMS